MSGSIVSGIGVGAVGLYALWLATDTAHALSAMAWLLGLWYFWLPRGKTRLSAMFERNLEHTRAWRALGLLMVIGDIISLAWIISYPGALR